MDRTAGATRRVGTAARRMADTTSAALGRTRRRVNDLIGRFRVLERTAGGAGGGALTGGIGRLAGYAGGGFALTRGGQQAASIDTLLRRLQFESDRPLEELVGLRDRAYEIGADRGVQARDLIQAVATAQGAGGVRIDGEDLESIAAIMQRAGISGEEAGNVWARVSVLPGNTRENVATLAMQADAGELTFRDMLGQITRMVAAVRTFGTDETAVRQMGALMNVARAGSGSVDEAGEAVATLTREALARADDIRKSFGVDVLSREAGREGFLRSDFFDVVLQIADQARMSGGEARIIEVFGADSLKALKPLLTKEGAEKARANLAIQGEWSVFEAQAAQVAEGIEAHGVAIVQKLEGQLTSLITGPMQGAFTLMQAHQTELMVGAAGVVAVMNLLSRYRLRRAVTEGLGARSAATSTVATMRVGTLIVGSVAGGAPTTRTAPGTVLGPDGKPAPRGGGAAPRGAPSRPGRLAGWGRALQAGRGIPYAGAAVAGLTLLPAVASGDTRSVVQSTAGLAGGLGLAKLGAAIGTAIAPGIGTAIGGLAGSLIGWFGGDQVAAALLDPGARRPRADVELDEEGRPTQSVRGRVRQRDLVARTAGVEREREDEDLDVGGLDVQPRRSVRGRVRQGELDSRVQSVTYDDHSTVTINVQAADDPARTAEMVADEVERRQRRRGRRIRDTILEDPEPDPEF